MRGAPGKQSEDHAGTRRVGRAFPNRGTTNGAGSEVPHLAHTYGVSIDHDTVYEAPRDLYRYREFVVDIRSYLESIDALGEENR